MPYPTTKLYPNELLQGAVARLVANYGLDPVYFTSQLLGTGNNRIKKVRSAVDFTEIQHIWENLWPGMDPEEVLRNHTLAPMLTWRKFIPEVKNVKSQVVKVGAGTEWRMWIPTGMGRCYYKFCPKCWENQRHKYGEKHWKTIWQVPGVDVWLRHGIALRMTKFRLDALGFPRKIGYVPASLYLKKSNPITLTPHSYLIAETAAKLLRAPRMQAITPEQWMYYMCYLLGEQPENISAVYKILRAEHVRRLIRNFWGAGYEAWIDWDHAVTNLRDFRWWGWLKLLKAVCPDKNFLEALRECALLTGQTGLDN